MNGKPIDSLVDDLILAAFAYRRDVCEENQLACAIARATLIDAIALRTITSKQEE